MDRIWGVSWIPRCYRWSGRPVSNLAWGWREAFQWCLPIMPQKWRSSRQTLPWRKPDTADRMVTDGRVAEVKEPCSAHIWASGRCFTDQASCLSVKLLVFADTVMFPGKKPQCSCTISRLGKPCVNSGLARLQAGASQIMIFLNLGEQERRVSPQTLVYRFPALHPQTSHSKTDRAL